MFQALHRRDEAALRALEELQLFLAPCVDWRYVSALNAPEDCATTASAGVGIVKLSFLPPFERGLGAGSIGAPLTSARFCTHICHSFTRQQPHGSMAKPPQEKQVLPGVFMTDFRRAPPADTPNSSLTSILAPQAADPQPEILLAEISRLQNCSACTPLYARLHLRSHASRAQQSGARGGAEGPVALSVDRAYPQ